MKKNQLLEEYFNERASKDNHRGGYPFVTISRQPGAGGHMLAEAIVERLQEKSYADLSSGWQVFDQKLCEFVAEEPSVQVSLSSLIREEYHSEIQDIVNALLGKYSSQLTVYKKTFEIVRTLAALGKVIIVGRAGNCLTHAMRTGIHIRLVASNGTRVKRMMRFLEVDEHEAQITIREQERESAKLVRNFFGKNIDDPLMYDVVWNTDTVAIEDIADSVVSMIDRMGHKVLAGGAESSHP